MVTTPRAYSASSTSTDAVTAVGELLAAIPPGVKPTFCLCACTVDLDAEAFFAELQRRLDKTTVVGTTSCRQVASDTSATAKAAALFVCGEGFVAGSASGTNADAALLGEQLTKTAMQRAGIANADAVRLVVVHAAPGIEAAVLAGLGKAVTTNAVVIGGSGADNDLSGKWRVFGRDGVVGNGAAVLVCDWPWTMAVSYQGGYLATGNEGRVTAAEGRRLISIDGEPAADVYDRWLGRKLPRNKSVLGETALRPFAMAHGVGGGLDVHVLVHPARFDDDGSITCFAEPEVGARILLMESSTASLMRRGGLVSRYAMQQAGVTVDDVVAGFLIYCAGCSQALGGDIVGLTDGIGSVLKGVPFLMPFSYGEQGRLRRQRIDHGNLMLSALLLTNKPVRA